MGSWDGYRTAWAVWRLAFVIVLVAMLLTPLVARPASAAGPVDGAPGIGDPYFPKLGNGGYDAEHYDVSLAFDLKQKTVSGTTTIDLTPTEDLRSFTLDLDGLEVSEVQVNWSRAAFSQEAKKLRVVPAKPLAEGRRAQVQVTYSGHPQGHALTGWFWFKGGGALLAPEPSGASTLFPCNDHPLDKATFAFHVTVPDGNVAVSNGALDDRTEVGDGTVRFDWHETADYPTYATVVAVGQFRLDDRTSSQGLPVTDALPVKQADKLAPRVEPEDGIVSVLEQFFGRYPFSAIGATVTPLGRVGAMEAAGRPTYAGLKGALHSKGFSQLMAHELSHQWTGDTVSLTRWQDIWLNEGFATYGELLWVADTQHLPIGSLFGRNSPYFHYYRGMKRPAGDPGPGHLFNVTVYNRGALTLEALRRTVGDDAFYRILREWVARYGGTNVTTDDFINLAEEISGQDLDALFQRWLYEPGLPRLPVEGGPPGALEDPIPDPELLDDALFRGHRVDDPSGESGGSGRQARHGTHSDAARHRGDARKHGRRSGR